MRHCARCSRDLPNRMFFSTKGYCRVCMADYKRQWRQRAEDPYRYEREHADEIAQRRKQRDRERHAGIPVEVRKLPPAPLERRVRAYIATEYAGQDGPSRFAQDFAERFDRKPESVRKWLDRIATATWVSIDMGDEMAVFIGSHPALVWPREWMTA